MIPQSINEVTPAWLSSVLHRDIEEIEVKQIGQGVGLLGDIFTVGLKGPGVTSANNSVVVKLPSSFEENREQAVSLGMFDAEIRFYSELAPDATVGLPEIYYTEIAPGGADFVIVMEDLSHLALVDQIEGLTVPQAEAAVRVLAQIHAVWWGRVQQQDYEWIPSMIGPRIEYVDQVLGQILPVFLAAFDKYLPPGGIEIYQDFCGNYLNVNRLLAARSPWTLVHQDYRVENMLFGPPGSGTVVVIDWQGIGRGPGVYDLAYILGGSMDTALRRQHESALVRTYHEALLESGVDGYTFDQLWDDYGLAHLQGGLATSLVTGGGMDLSNERGARLVKTMASRHAQAALDHDGLARLQQLSG